MLCFQLQTGVILDPRLDTSQRAVLKPSTMTFVSACTSLSAEELYGSNEYACLLVDIDIIDAKTCPFVILAILVVINGIITRLSTA